MNSSGLDLATKKFIEKNQIKMAIIGGSGICTFSELKERKRIKLMTQYGPTSDDIIVGEYNGRMVAFLPRHGEKHTIPPHKVPYKANMAALKMIGIEYIFGTCIVGSLKKEIVPGSMVILDQFVNLTWGRDDFFDVDKRFIHLPMANPYCEHLRQILLETAGKNNFSVITNGTVVVIQGPRFSTIAESRWFASNGWDVVNMTQYPECYFARELGMCYAAIASVTDYDVGVADTFILQQPEHVEEVLRVFKNNVCKTKNLMLNLIQDASDKLSCECSSLVLKMYYS